MHLEVIFWFFGIESQSCVCDTLNLLQGANKTLVLREIPEDGIKKFLSNKESLATCDIAAFVYDR